MAINQLGQVAFANLDQYTWQAADFTSFQTYLQAYLNELGAASWGAGVVYGGALSVQSNLTVAVAKLMANFSGQVVTHDADQIALAAADPTNPRIDRIELGWAFTNNRNVVNINGQTVVFDQEIIATLYVNQGTPGVSPSANATTSGRLSLGLVTVNANQTLLTTASFNQSEQARDIARPSNPSEHTVSLNNNQATFIDVPDLFLNNSLTRRATVKGYVYLTTSSAEALYDVIIECRYKPVAGSWSCDVTIDGPDESTYPGLDFQISNAGHFQYVTPNLSGTGFTGIFKYRVTAMS